MDDEHKSDTTTQKPLGKRDSNGEIKCKCKGDCTKKRCSCSKNGNPCSLKCNCDDDKCKNRSTTQEPDFSEVCAIGCLTVVSINMKVLSDLMFDYFVVRISIT